MKTLLFICLNLSLFVTTGYSQVLPVNAAIQNSYDRFRSQVVQEKIYVHTDKDSYVSREILWFRIYYIDAFDNKQASLSKIAYAEILDKNNLPVLQEKISLKPGESDGSLILPVNIASGTYKFRVYTNWMKNFGPEYFFEKPIRVINPQNLQSDSTIVKKKLYDIQFFPEGGNLVQGIESKVGFRVTDPYGKGLNFDGVLLNANGDSVSKFYPAHLGLGSFVFTPANGQNYKAIIRFPGGEQVTKELPTVYQNGFVMNLKKSAEGQIAVQVSGSSDMDLQDVYLFIHGNRSSMPVQKQTLTGRSANFLIKPEDLEDGISQFTVFNTNGKPVCERLYFKYPSRDLIISAEVGPQYETRKKVDLNVVSTSQSGNALAADISLAVYRLDSLQHLSDYDIRSYFYLIADLGPVESPSFYFTDKVKSREADMDNLMLTHGWRRYNWNDLVKQKTYSFEFPPEIGGHILHGKVISKTGAPVPNADAYLSIPSGRTQFRPTTSDDKGNLKFELTGFYGSQEIIIQTGPKEDSTAHIEIASPFSKQYSPYVLPNLNIPSINSPELRDQSIHEQVQHIYDGPRLNRFTLQPVDTNAFYVVPDEKYMLDDYVRFITMEEVLREYVHSVNVIKRKDKYGMYLVNNPYRQFFTDQSLILIDGVPFFDANELFLQDPKRIKRLDLINREYSLGDKTFPGIVNVTTYHGDLEGIQMNAHATVLDYPGIPEQREFFSPVYETEAQITSRMPDYRTLLYWNPEIKSGEQGKKTVSFYTSDLPGKYAVVVQGLSENGEPGSQVSFFSVKK